MKPLLAAKVDFEKIRYPVLGSPKLDGIRCVMINGVAYSRSKKPIPNKFIQSELEGLHGLDGELMLSGDFNAVQSGVMSREGAPDFTYHVFDYWDSSLGYSDRLRLIRKHSRVVELDQTAIDNFDELDELLEFYLACGYEGLMIRDPDGAYKHGRSTVNDGILAKVKRFHDDEAVLVDITEKYHNENELGADELGYAKRRLCKANLVPAGTCGAFVLNWDGVNFKVGFGPGITDSIKLNWWENRGDLIGKLVTFRYQELSKDGVPRFGKVVGFRHVDDIA